MDLFDYAEKDFGGVYALMLTPYKHDLSVDWGVYEKYCDYQAASGAHKLFCVCGSSEMTKLSIPERLKLAEITVKRANGLKVFATANLSEGLENQLEEIKRMEETGVDGLVFVTHGMGEKPEFVEYIGALANAASLPALIYEFPGMSPHRVGADIYGELVRYGYIKGIKDTTSTLEGIAGKLDRQGDSCVLQANIPFLYDAFELGARGCVATPSTVGSSLIRKFYDAYAAGDKTEAKRLHGRVCMLADLIDQNYTAGAKYFMRLKGVPFEPLCRTGATLSGQRCRHIEACV
ncbi:MAG: dihydrodipicolinate synthase family protein, partial [Clostridia bacterium]|nr:dihydrodipicolinate synthase family protein [Clostridia bacterium]